MNRRLRHLSRELDGFGRDRSLRALESRSSAWAPPTTNWQRPIYATCAPVRTCVTLWIKSRSAKSPWHFLAAVLATRCGRLAPLLGVLHAVRLEARADSAGRLIAREQACAAPSIPFPSVPEMPSGFHHQEKKDRMLQWRIERKRSSIALAYSVLTPCQELSYSRKPLALALGINAAHLCDIRAADPCPAPPSHWRSQ